MGLFDFVDRFQYGSDDLAGVEKRGCNSKAVSPRKLCCETTLRDVKKLCCGNRRFSLRFPVNSRILLRCSDPAGSLRNARHTDQYLRGQPEYCGTQGKEQDAEALPAYPHNLSPDQYNLIHQNPNVDDWELTGRPAWRVNPIAAFLEQFRYEPDGHRMVQHGPRMHLISDPNTDAQPSGTLWRKS
ncbi:hypothetical protein FN846DRAFT_62521 [Sphaerosporella brunnea]|uniref:Uncharacterized protein n=1 Tax=Sphaerosporella brunnea TaxID=1250544 RepID=A0A5J5EUZ8_9PEZI|nr:hypothetical protein FN846DRAFT_62521 [Sphaerosporella brunnea]